MLIRMPSEPPEKWRTVQAALETKEKTRRLCLILLVSSIPLCLVLAAAVVLAVTRH